MAQVKAQSGFETSDTRWKKDQDTFHQLIFKVSSSENLEWFKLISEFEIENVVRMKNEGWDYIFSTI